MSYSDIVSEEMQMGLIKARDNIKDANFYVGDCVNTLKMFYAGSMVVLYKDIYAAVAYFSGKSKSTVRQYSYIASMFDEAVRKRYEVLSFDHFKFASRYKDRALDILEYAVTEGVGGPVSVDALIAKFSPLRWKRDFIARMYDEFLDWVERMKESLPPDKASRLEAISNQVFELIRELDEGHNE